MVCSELATSLGATGGLMLSEELQSRSPWLPHSESIAEVTATYYADGWHRSDIRAERGFTLASKRGYVTDYDIMDASELTMHPFYAELILPAGLQWFAATAIRVAGKTWALSLQRTPAQDAFQTHELLRLSGFRDQFRLAVRRAHALGHRRIETLEEVYSAATHGFLTLDATGRVNSINASAEAMLSEAELLRNGRLAAESDPTAAMLQGLLEAVLYGATILPPPLQLTPAKGPCLIIDAIPMPRDFNALLTGATAIVTVRPWIQSVLSREALRRAFALTAREAQLAEVLALGSDLGEIADMLGLSVATVRQHLKAIFKKTKTHRQAELVTLLAKYS